MSRAQSENRYQNLCIVFVLFRFLPFSVKELYVSMVIQTPKMLKLKVFCKF